jgi:beta-glucanase (GH16 family)
LSPPIITVIRYAFPLTTIFFLYGSILAEPSGTPEKPRPIWIEAEDFTTPGGWIVAQNQTALMGRTTGKSSNNQNLTASTKIKVETSGAYKLWVRANGSKNLKKPRDFRISINSVVSPEKLGSHGSDGWAWQNAGVFRLEKGDVAIELVDSSQYYARCDKLLLTPDLNYTPKGTGAVSNAQHIQPEGYQPPQYARATFNDLRAGSLADQTGGEGFDRNGGWSVQGNINILAGDLQMPASNGREFVLSQSGRSSLISAGVAGTSQAVRRLAAPMKGKVWFRFLVKPQDPSGSAGIKLLPNEEHAPGYEILATGTDLSFKYPDPSKIWKIENALSVGKTSLVLGSVDVDADRDGNRTLSIWLDPDVGKPGKPDIERILPESIPSITHLGLVMSAGASQATGPLLDEVILSNHAYPAGYYHVAPRKRHFGRWHIPVKVAETVIQLPPPGYRLVFSDEFDSKQLDHAEWSYRLRDKADSAQEAENVEVRDGNLVIHARKQRLGNYHYTGGGIISNRLFVYGYYESRFRIPASEGWHTAFWTMPEYKPKEVRNTEIDFCEQDSGDPHYFSLGLINHREKGWNASNIGRWVVEDAPNMVEEYVTIAAEFTPETIRFYMNGRLVKEVDSRLFPHGPATVQLSCIASRKKGDRFQDDARLPSQATFDYVRVYQHPRYADAEAAARTKAVLPTKPLPPLSERVRPDAKTGELD